VASLVSGLVVDILSTFCVETDQNSVSVLVSAPKLTKNAVSVTVTTPHFTFGFGRNYTAETGVSEIMEDLRR